MRIAVYVVLSLCICLIIADGFYVQRLYTTDEEPDQQVVQFLDLDSVLESLAELQRRARHDDVLLQVRDALRHIRMHGSYIWHGRNRYCI